VVVVATATATVTATASQMPQAILLSDVAELGERGNVVEVSKGYLRNYLIPRKLAQPATAGALAAASQRAAAADRAARHAAEQAEETAALLSRTVLTIAQQAGDDGRLFGSVTPQDIVDAISESRGLKLDRRGVALEEPIKNVGTYMVVVEVGPGVTATVKTIVTAA
jgi:large subunit ribosomal protein L9